MNNRINIVLPETTIKAMASVAGPGERSRFIDQAVRHFIAHNSSEAIGTQLERVVISDRDPDREIGSDWFALDNETLQQFGIPNTGKRPTEAR